jgi:hypothetical protein
MVKPPAKKPGPKKPAKPKPRPIIWRSRPKVKRTAAERKSHAIELCLNALAGGWTIARFCRHSHVHKATMLRWLAEDTVQPRFLKAMQVKALALPDDASEIVRKIIDGTIDPKAGGVALRHLEFRMMREIKSHYSPHRTVSNTTDMSDAPDDVIDQRFNELMERHQKALPAPSGEAQGPETDPAAG